MRRKLWKTDKARIDKAIRRGVRELNKHVPGWRAKINWDEFDYTRVDRCVLGQLAVNAGADDTTGFLSTGAFLLGWIAGWGDFVPVSKYAKYGFIVDDCTPRYANPQIVHDYYQAEWLKAGRRRTRVRKSQIPF